MVSLIWDSSFSPIMGIFNSSDGAAGRREPEDRMLQNATRLRKLAAWPPNISDEHVLCTAPATRHAPLQIHCKCATPAIVFGHATKPSRFAHFWQGAESLAPATQNHIWTFKRIQKSSEHVVLLPFWLGNVLPAATAGTFFTSEFWLPNVLRVTTACTCSTCQLPKVVRYWGVLCILNWKCASRHNACPSRATNHWKNTVFLDFSTFSRTCTFFLLTLSLLWSSLFCSSLLWLFSPLLFHLSILSEVWLLNFLP